MAPPIILPAPDIGGSGGADTTADASSDSSQTSTPNTVGNEQEMASANTSYGNLF